ncbi:hypothetical protein E4T39_06963 [Aureobasidium subglaciale]|nr:hypothetical protein E4T39_06963 [Aureobasidium subglaciale]
METAESLRNDKSTIKSSKSDTSNKDDEVAKDDDAEGEEKTTEDDKRAMEEKAKKRQRVKPPPSPLAQRVLISRLLRDCSVIEQPNAEIMLDELEDVLTRFGSCLIEQLCESDFLPTDLFRMNDIVEVGGAELRLRNGRRFIPNTQIRFLGSHYPAIIIRVVRVKAYAKVVEDTRQALHCMEGKLRIAIVIKIDKAHVPTAEHLRGQSDEESGPTVKQKDKRLSVEDRITVKIFQVYLTEKFTGLYIGMEEEVFPRATTNGVCEWHDISPNFWSGPAPMPQIRSSLAPLSQSAHRFMDDEPALVGLCHKHAKKLLQHLMER